MAQFQFRLKALLAVREAARDERLAQLAEAFAAQQKLDERRAALNHQLAEQQHVFRQRTAAGTIDVDGLLSANRFDLVLRAELNVIDHHERNLAPEIERRRQAVVAAEREVRVLEKLRERQLEQFRQQEALADMKRIDEIAARIAVTEEILG